MHLEAGDILACHAIDWTGRCIRWGTATLAAPPRLRIGPSHVAIIADYKAEPVWVESTTLCHRACLIQGRPVAGVQAHSPILRAQDYLAAGGRVDVFRLTDINQLSLPEVSLLNTILFDHFLAASVDYDLRGALLSGTRLFSLSRWFPAANLDHLFCSELVAAAVMRLNRLNHANPSRYHPARLLRELVRTGKYRYHGTWTSGECR